MNCEKCGHKLIVIVNEKGLLIYCPICIPNADNVFMNNQFLSGLECELCILHDAKTLPKNLEEFMKPILRKRDALRKLAKERSK